MVRRIKPFKRGAEGRFVPSRKLVRVTRKADPTEEPIRIRRLIWQDYNWIIVESTNIRAIAYKRGGSPKSGRLFVSFLSGKSAEYHDVPFEKFEAFYYAVSMGGFFHKEIRNGGYMWNYI